MNGITASRAGNDPAKKIELPTLTSLRGLAALAVVLFHAGFLAVNYAGAGSPFFARGNLAVDLFFFLSGFVLTHVYGYRFIRDLSVRSVGRFFWARFCRIYPTSLFVTLVYVLAHTIGRLTFPADVSFPKQLIASLLLIQVPWLHEIWINRVAWSISAECYAYLMFPLAVPVILNVSFRMFAILGVILLACIALLPSLGVEGQSGWGALVRAIPEFTAGIFAYRAYHCGFLQEFWRRDAVFIGAMGALGAAVWAGLSDGVIAVLLLVLLLASVSNTGRIVLLIDARPLRWLGDISYSVYIFQMLPFQLMTALSVPLVAFGLGGRWFGGIAVLLAVGGGVLVHRCVDVPVRAALRQLPQRIAVTLTAAITPDPTS